MDSCVVDAEKQGTLAAPAAGDLLSALPELNNMGLNYTSDSTDTRWLILSDTEQDFPTETFTVEEAKEQKTHAGKAMPILVLKGTETGDVVQICAWKRDVLPCIKQYGGNTDQWEEVRFVKKGKRYVLEPVAMHVVEERV